MAQVPSGSSPTPKASSRFRSLAQDATIHITIHGSDSTIYLNPKPGDTSVRQGRLLYLVVMNLTDRDLDVEVEFEYPIEATFQTIYPFRAVRAGAVEQQRLHVDPQLFAQRKVDPLINVIANGYCVSVNGNPIIDPDVKIQR